MDQGYGNGDAVMAGRLAGARPGCYAVATSRGRRATTAPRWTKSMPRDVAQQEQLDLAHCLKRLSADQKRAVISSFLHGYTHKELAGALGVPLGTAKSWTRRGAERLKLCLGACAWTRPKCSLSCSPSARSASMKARPSPDGTPESLLPRMEPGAAIPEHFHDRVEECLIVHGDLVHAGETLGPGDFTIAPRGGNHAPMTTRTGGLLYVRYLAT